MTAQRPFLLWLIGDESGNLPNSEDAFMVIAIVATQYPDILMRITLETKQARRLARGVVLHATDDHATATELLRRLSKSEGTILTVVALDRQWFWRPDLSSQELYQDLAAYALQRAIDMHNTPCERIQVIMEGCYTRSHRQSLQHVIAIRLDIDPQQVLQEPKDSPSWGPGLQIADAVAWAHFRKFARGDIFPASLVEHLVGDEELVGVDTQGRICPVNTMTDGKQKGRLT